MSEEFMKHVAEKLKLDNDRLIAERDEALEEVESYKEKEKICTSCEHHPDWKTIAEKALAKIESLKQAVWGQTYGKYGSIHYCTLAEARRSRIEVLEIELQQVKEMLRKCSPIIHGSSCLKCRFCLKNMSHTSNCDYIKMTEEG